MRQVVNILTPDGATLAASLFDADGEVVAVFNCAMGVKRGFYEAFAQYLAENGITALVWEYRGVGDSAPERLSGYNAHIHDWGETDLTAVIHWAKEHYPQKKLVIIGHSMGGQLIGMSPQSKNADAIVIIASQSGYWGHWRGFQRWRIFIFWHFLIPVLSRFLGYFPAQLFGAQARLPAGAARQWARWGRDPEYLQGKHARASAVNYGKIDSPLLSIWISDDDISPHAANRAMLGWYKNAHIETIELHAADIGEQRIGHFGWFRKQLGEKTWPPVIDWLRKTL
ncbi:MAG: alpha/beta fold hydrolase [Gammaproteobacteria bacterium]|nr:alpha/beta fold hydrolase [Gammaproteobacteria bacterium]